jgi:hypothetical protein
VAAEHRRESTPRAAEERLAGLDKLLGGGWSAARARSSRRGGNRQVHHSRPVLARAAERGEHSAMFIFDESINTLFSRLTDWAST